jgi:hypothetical protein
VAIELFYRSAPVRPVLGASAVVHEGDEADSLGVEPVQKTKGKSAQNPSSNNALQQRRCSRMLDDRLEC